MSNKINFDEKLVFDIYGEKSELSLEGLETYYEGIGLPTPWGYARDSFAYGLALKSVGKNEKKAETLYWTYKALEMSFFESSGKSSLALFFPIYVIAKFDKISRILLNSNFSSVFGFMTENILS